MEAGEEVGFTDGDGMVGCMGEAGKGGGARIDAVNVMPDRSRAHATIGGEYPGEEEAVTGG